MSDDELFRMSGEIDEFFISIAEKYQVGFPDVCGILLARMYLLAKQLGASSNFIRLLTTIISTEVASREMAHQKPKTAPLDETAVNDAKILANELLAKIASDSKKGN
jgi:hypothetical protein